MTWMKAMNMMSSFSRGENILRKPLNRRKPFRQAQGPERADGQRGRKRREGDGDDFFRVAMREPGR